MYHIFTRYTVHWLLYYRFTSCTFLYYYAYISLPWQIYYPLVIITFYLVPHCNKGEYISFSAEQRPPDQCDWDVESKLSVIAEQHDEDRLGAKSDSINGENPEEPEVAHFIIGDNVNGDTTPRYGSINNQVQV